MTTFITIAYALVCLMLIGIILINPSKGGGDLGSIFGAGGGSAFGTSSEDILTKTTKILAGLFAVLALSLAWSGSHRSSIIQKKGGKFEAPKEAASVAPKPKAKPKPVSATTSDTSSKTVSETPAPVKKAEEAKKAAPVEKVEPREKSTPVKKTKETKKPEPAKKPSDNKQTSPTTPAAKNP